MNGHRMVDLWGTVVDAYFIIGYEKSIEWRNAMDALPFFGSMVHQSGRYGAFILVSGGRLVVRVSQIALPDELAWQEKVKELGLI